MILSELWNRWLGKEAFTGKGNYGEIWKIAWPFIILNAANTVMMVTNRVFLSNYSAATVTAAMPAGQLFFTFMIMFLMTTGFTSTLVAQYFGAGEKENCIRAAWNGFYFSAGISFLLCFLMPLAGPFIFARNGHDPMISALEAEYFSAMSACAAFTCLETPLFSFFTGRGKSRVLAVVKGLGCAISIPLNYLFIYGKCGFPELGILGAGLANSTANGCTFLIILTCFLLTDQKEYPTRKIKTFSWDLLKKLFIFGVPVGFQAFLRNVSVAIVIMLIGTIGNEELAATSIALCINMVGNMPIFGMADATGILIGQYIGKKDIQTAAKILWQAFRLLMVWIIPVSLLYLYNPDILIDLFGTNDNSGGIDLKETREYVHFILMMAVIFNFFDALRFMIIGALRGAGDTRITFLIGISTAWIVQLPGIVLLVYVFHGTIRQIWLYMTFYVIVDAVCMLLRWRSGAWKKIKIIEG